MIHKNKCSLVAVLYKLSNFLFQMSWVTDLRITVTGYH